MNLIYMCVFHKESYIKLLELLIKSISVKSNLNINTTDILIITSPKFQNSIEDILKEYNLSIKMYLLDLETIFEAGCARLSIFKYKFIDLYEKILYLDVDVLVNSDINILFNLDIDPTKIYALEEGQIQGIFWGSEFFDLDKFYRWSSAFSSGVMYFRNSQDIKILFENIQKHIQKYVYEDKNPYPVCLDQPFIIYNAFLENKYDNQFLKKYVENNPGNVEKEKIIYHFPGLIGNYDFKNEKMTDFWKKML